jgi:hypothetical protein
MGGAFTEIEEIFRPQARHEIEAREEVVRQDEKGDPPDPDVSIRSD